tara:strand:+ start:48244 stop:50139 length:1896 start_codon:yes stop_codon:yes gene_type:complete
MSAKSATASKPKPAAKKPAAKKPAAPKAAPRKAARAEAPAAVTGPAVITIPHDQIAPSPLNPRKTISEEYITDLAASMLAKGQLQNISVRPASDKRAKVKFQIIYGEQRWRAIGKLVADGHLPKDTPVLARVMPIDDAEHIELAIMENQDRNEVHPLEQAEAYARLAELRAVTAPDAAAVTTLIAQRTGQTTRNIQLQLQVARNLTPETKQAWTDGKIATRKMAIAIARQPAAIQAAILEAMEWDDLRTPQDLAQWLENAAFKADVALFDLAAYEKAGGVIALHPASDEAWLDSQDVFLDLQGKAAEKRAGDLSKILGLTRPAQKSATYWTRTSGPRLIDEASGPDEGLNGPADCASSAHVEYAINAQTGIAWFGLVGAEQEPAGTDGGVEETTAAAKGDTVQPLARRNWLAGGAARTRVVRDAIRAHPDYALAVAIVALLPKHRDYDADLCAIRTEWPTGDSAVARQDMEDIWPELLTGLPGFSLGEITDRNPAMTALLALTHEELLSVFAHMIANRCSDVPFTAGPGAKPESCVIAGFHGEFDLNLAGLCNEPWLKGYTVAQLQAIAHDSGAAAAMASEGAPLPANKAGLVEALPKFLSDAYIPPEARFLSAEAAEKAVGAMLAKGGAA